MPQIAAGCKNCLAGAVLLLACTALAACDTTTPEEHFASARNYYAAGEIRTAVIELKNALQKAPDLAEARRLLGESHARLGDYPSALKEFERALDLGLDDAALRLGLLHSKNRLGRYQEVIGELEQAGALTPEFAVELADAYLSARDLAKARPLYEQALGLAGGNLGLGTIAWLQGDHERAARYLEQAVTLDPAGRDAWLRKGEFELATGSLDSAAASFNQARDLPGGQITGSLGLARVFLADGRSPAAAAEVAEVLRLAPSLFVAHYLDGLVKFQNGDIDGAEAALREVQRSVPGHPPSLYLMGAVKFQQNQLSQAEDNLQRFLAQDPNNESAAKLLASVRQQQGDQARALATLNPFLESTLDPQLLAMAGTIELRLGDAVAATRLLERAVELAPDMAPFRNQLALSLLSTGDQDRANVELETAIAVDAEQFQSDYLLAMLRLRDNDYAAALEAVNAIISKSPENPLGYNLKGAVLLGQGDQAGAIDAFEQALGFDPGYLPAASNLARLAERNGDIGAARARYSAVLESAPGTEGALLALADLAARQSDFAAAEQHLLAVIADNPDSLRARLGLLRLYLTQNRVNEADLQAAAATVIAPRLPDVMLLHAEVDLRKGDVAAARERAESLQALVADRSNQPLLLTALGNLQSRVGLLTLARTNLTAAIAASNGAAPVALRELARLDLHDNQPQAARARLDELLELDSESPAVRLLEADILLVEGNSAAAQDRFTELAAAGLRDAAMRLALLRMGQNENAPALAGLDDWLAAHPGDIGVQILRADVLMRQTDKSAAIGQYEKLLEADNPVVLNNLAWLYMEREDERALSTARRAHDLAPDSSDIADTLGWILLQSGQAQEALSFLRQSVQANPKNASVQYHLGLAYREAGDNAAAVRALRDAIALGEFPEQDDAQQVLTELSGA